MSKYKKVITTQYLINNNVYLPIKYKEMHNLEFIKKICRSINLKKSLLNFPSIQLKLQSQEIPRYEPTTH